MICIRVFSFLNFLQIFFFFFFNVDHFKSPYWISYNIAPIVYVLGFWPWGVEDRSSAESVSCSVVSHSWWPHGLQPSRLLCPWDSPGKNTGVGCHALLQGIFSTQGSYPGLLHCRRILYCLSQQGSPHTFWFSSQYSYWILCCLGIRRELLKSFLMTLY